MLCYVLFFLLVGNVIYFPSASAVGLMLLTVSFAVLSSDYLFIAA